ncbi:unnamed protein product [Diamesa hyperborea]
MSHMYSISKGGDQLCPLGFHPQVRWPTRCKRCFRDYKEHGSRRNGEDIASSSPSLSDGQQRNARDTLDRSVRSWTSTQNLSTNNDNHINVEIAPPIRLRQRPSSWSSTPDLDEAQKSYPKVVEEVVVNVQLPARRRHTAALFDNIEESFTLKRPPISNGNAYSSNSNNNSKPVEEEEAVVITKSDSLAERVRKMQMMKRQGSLERELSKERETSVPRNDPQQEVKRQEPETQSLRRRRANDPLPPIPGQNPTATRPRNDTLPPIPDARPPRARSEVLQPVSEVKPKVVIKKPPVIKPPAPTPTDNHTSNNVQFSIQVKDPKKIKKLDDVQSNTTNTTETTVGRRDNELKQEIEMLRRELDASKARCERAERDKSDILLRRLASMDTSTNRTAAAEALKLQQQVNEMKQQVEELQDDKKSLTSKVKELSSEMNGRASKSMEEMLRNKLEQAERMCEALMDENEDMKREVKNMEAEIDEMQDNFREEQADEYVSVKKELEQTTKNCRILSFKLKKSDRKIEMLEGDKQDVGTQSNTDLVTKIKKLEDDLKIANEVARRLQAETETEPKRKAPALGKIGKSTSDGGKISRASLTRGGSQEDPVQLLRDLQDSMEREADLREQLKFAEEEAECLRKKSSRVDDENESLVMQLKKMATKARSRKLSPNPPKRHSLVEKDEGISDEEDTAELKLQLELNEQETAVLRRKLEALEKENETSKKQVTDLHDKLLAKSKEMNLAKKAMLKTSPLTKDPLSDKKLQVMEEEMNELRKKLIEKDRDFERVQAEISISKGKPKSSTLKSKTKTQTLEQENDKMLAEVKQLQLQVARGTIKSTPVKDSTESDKLKKTVEELEKEREELKTKLKIILEEPVSKLPARIPKVYSDIKTKMQLKKMIEELEEEVTEMRAIALRTSAYKLKKLEEDNTRISDELTDVKTRYDDITRANNSSAISSVKLKDVETKLQKTQDDNKSLLDKIKTVEDKITKQELSIKQADAAKTLVENQLKSEKEKATKVEKEIEKIKTERLKLETKASALDVELAISKKTSEKTKLTLEKEIAALKTKTSLNNELPSKKLQELQEQNKELDESLNKELKKYATLTGQYELLEEEHVLIKAQLTTEKEKIESDLKSTKTKLKEFEDLEVVYKREKADLAKKITDLQRKLAEAELQGSKVSTNSFELDRSRLKSKLEEKESDYNKLVKQNDMNVDQLSQIRKENDEMKRKLDDFERIDKVQRTLNDHNSALENELKKLKVKLDNSELSVKSEVASTRLRYETQINTLQNELTSIHRQCERFKKDRDSYKQLLEAAQKNIGELKKDRKSYASTSSGDEDDKSKIQGLEQQVGCLEDELSESRLEASKLRTELISDKSGFEIRISEMQSKMNEYEEERILGNTKISGTKTRLELSWQKEREDQQRLLQETSTLARDLRQTLFEVERERDKERLESRRKIDQIKKATEEELEEGRRKISELQSDLLELRDAHAKLRTANEKLRRDRDRYERERESGTKRRLEQVGERKVGALLQTVDELVKIAPEFQKAEAAHSISSTLSIPNAPQRSKSRSPSPSAPSAPTMQISQVLARLAEASDELRRYQRLCDEEKDRDRVRRGGMRRAASTENDNGIDNNTNRPIARINRASHGSLYRKSLSLDQSMQGEQQQQIWKDSDGGGSMSSMQSIDSEYGIRRGDSSMDSRLSAGSTQSDMPRSRKKKKGLMGKLRSLTKSRGTESDASHLGSDSDVSLAGDHRSSKKDLKGRLSGMFKRAGSSSRAGSQEKMTNDSQQRPISIASNGGSTNTLPQPSSTATPKKPPTPTQVRRVKPPVSTITSSTITRSKS